MVDYRFVAIFLSSFLGAIVTPLPLEKKRYFPEQVSAPPPAVRDGGIRWDRMFLMRLLTALENEAQTRLGRPKVDTVLREYIFEGDIMLSPDQAVSLVTGSRYETKPEVSERLRRKRRKVDTGVTYNEYTKKWKLPINYVFDGSHTTDEQESIRRGIYHWQQETCINFTNLAASNNTKSILFVNHTACTSSVGYIDDGEMYQNISISFKCLRKGIVAHEIGHALGFWHEHARNDREQHIRIRPENIQMGCLHNFVNQSWENITTLNVPYDVGSVMHYSGEEFDKFDARDRSQLSIEALNPLLQHTLGQREELSFFDVKLANLAYCNDVCSPALLPVMCLHEGYQDPRNCSRCRCAEGLAGDRCETVAKSTHDCGGVIDLTTDVTKIIATPSYPSQYQPGIRCYWLIQSPPGTVVKSQFLAPYIQSESCIDSDPYKPCEDFVEIRPFDNLGLTGGRFCCNYSAQTDHFRSPIVSHSNHTLVIFRTIFGVTRGFRLQVSAMSCGGCADHVTAPQVSCIRQRHVPCEHTWQTTEVDTTCLLPFWGCTRQVTRQKSRISDCLIEEFFCCTGYNLSADNSTCTKNVSEVAGIGTEVLTEPVGWGNWSEWSACSVTCGGCGTQSRSRKCLSTTENCNGTSEEVRSCGESPCATGNVMVTCSTTRTMAYSCAFMGTCYRLETIYQTQKARCCCGYDVRDSICLPKSR